MSAIVGVCPACAGSPMPGMQRTCESRGRAFWKLCSVCRGRERIEILTDDEAKLSVVWMRPSEVKEFKATKEELR